MSAEWVKAFNAWFDKPVYVGMYDPEKRAHHEARSDRDKKSVLEWAFKAGRSSTTTPSLREAADEIHPDPLIAREVEMDYLQGLLSEARGALKRALDYKAATPDGLKIKKDIRSGLDRIGWEEIPPLRSSLAHPRSQEGP